MKLLYKVVAIVAIIAIVSGGSLWYLLGNQPSSKLTVVRFSTDWMIQGSHAWILTAMEKGYFADEGLEVIIYPGAGSGDAVRKVGLGQVDFAYVEPSAVIAGISQNAEVKFVAAVLHSTDLAWNVLNISGVNVPKDLEGKTVAGSADDTGMILWPSFAKANDINVSKVRVETISYDVYRTLNFQGEVQATPGTTIDFKEWNDTAREQGMRAYQLTFKDWNLDLTGEGIITRTGLLQENPDTVRRFLRASFKGMIYAYQHPAEAIDYVMRSAPEYGIDQSIAEYALSVFNSMISPYVNLNDPTKTGLFTDSAKMQLTVDTMRDALGITTEITAASIYTNDFL